MKYTGAHGERHPRRRIQAIGSRAPGIILFCVEYFILGNDPWAGLQVCNHFPIFLWHSVTAAVRAYAGAARVNSTRNNLINPVFTTLSHMIIFVQPSPNGNQTYLVDVGFALMGPVRPMLLSDAKDSIVMGMNPTEMHRLTRGPHPLSSTSCGISGSSYLFYGCCIDQ